MDLQKFTSFKEKIVNNVSKVIIGKEKEIEQNRSYFRRGRAFGKAK